MSQKEIMLVSAEASSNTYAQSLMAELKKHGDYRFWGVGSKAMVSCGFEALGLAEEMAVVGVSEIIGKYQMISNVFAKILARCNAKAPDICILMDYPEFNMRLAKKLHGLGIKVIYYISPQIWAWRSGRVKDLKKYCDLVLLLFPFEVDFYREHQVPHIFVGHPLIDEVADKKMDAKKIQEIRRSYGWGPQAQVVAIMPGSRRSELDLNLPTQLEVAKKLVKNFTQVKVVFLIAPTIDKHEFIERLVHVHFPYSILQNDPMEMLQLIDLALVTSGTATLQLGLFGKPMVIMYKMKTFTYWIARAIVHGVKYFGLVNLIAQREIVPERWQNRAQTDELVELLSRFLSDPAYYAETQNLLLGLQEKLGSSGVTARVCAAVESLL